MPISLLELPHVLEALKRFHRALEAHRTPRRGSAILNDARDELLKLLMPSGVDYNCREASFSDITQSDLDLEHKVILKELLRDYLSPIVVLRVSQQREETLFKLYGWIKRLEELNQGGILNKPPPAAPPPTAAMHGEREKPPTDPSLTDAKKSDTEKPPADLCTMGIALLVTAHQTGEKLNVTKLAQRIGAKRQQIYENEEFAKLREMARKLFGWFSESRSKGDWSGPRGTKEAGTVEAWEAEEDEE